MYETLCLSALAEGESAYVTEISAGPAMDRRLTDLGLVRGTRVTCVLRSPAGDPVPISSGGRLSPCAGRTRTGCGWSGGCRSTPPGWRSHETGGAGGQSQRG